LQYDADNDGDIDASDKIVFIHERLDSTHYVVKLADGTNPAAMTFPDTNWSIFRSYTSLSNAEAGTENTGIDSDLVNFDTGNVNLTTNNLQWNFACYANGTTADTTAVMISGWTTAFANYIKIYTPTASNEVGVSQRHNGKWDGNKYKLEVVDSNILYIVTDYVKTDGLQFQITSSSGVGKVFYANSLTAGANRIEVSNNIMKGVSTGGTDIDGIDSGYANNDIYIWNNILYDFNDIGTRTPGKAYIYNNTVVNVNQAIHTGLSLRVVAKNNLVKGSGNSYIGTFATGTDYNSTDSTDDIGAGSNNRISQTFTFIDEANDDFHLASTDAGAKNFGTDLRTDAYLPINRDIDYASESDSGAPESDSDAFGNRPSGSAFDIGADERLTNVYYSVSGGGDTTTDRKVAATATIANGLMTFSAPQTGNIGVGDVIDYDSDNKKAYISGKVDQSNWQVVNNLGDKPADISSGVTVNSIKRVWGSLSLAEAGSSGASYINTSDLGSAGVVLNLPCYYDTGADNTAVTIDGWTTAANNYIKVYTPNNTATEANFSQRHSGKWDEGKYSIQVGTGVATLFLKQFYTLVDGLQITNSGTASSDDCISVDGYRSFMTISNNIIKGGYHGFYHGNLSYAGGHKVLNNIVYNTYNAGIMIYSSSNYASYYYNNTVYHCNYGNFASRSGIQGPYGNTIGKNNIAIGNGNADFINSSISNNISSDATAGGTNSLINKSLSDIKFVSTSSGTEDLHIDIDSVARGMGTDLRFDPNLPVATDIDSNARTYADKNADIRGSSIGADEPANKIFRSVGPSATSAITTGGSNAMTISGNIATFATALADNIGVGDAIQYDSDNNSSIDSIAFIAKRTDSTHYVLQSPHGTYPNQTSASDNDWSLFRAYSSLLNAEAATENTGINASYRNFDDWSGGKNISATNEQWNLAAYANGTTADTVAVTIGGWTTGLPNYVKIYTPTQTTEVGTSQRHQGKSGSNYKLYRNGYGVIFSIDYAWVDGLEIETYSTLNPPIYVASGKGEIQVSNCLTKSSGALGSFYINSGDHLFRIWNNIFYGFKGVDLVDSRSAYLYNNTVYYTGTYPSSTFGIRGNANTYAKNNISQGFGGEGGYYDYTGSFNAASANNISLDASSPNSGATDCGGHSCRNQTVNFSDSANKDFHLAASDTAARNAGTDLSADAYFAFASDIDGHTRSTSSHTGAWDIGADEGATAMYFSVGQNVTSHETGSGTVAITSGAATFSVAQTATNMGVGDAVVAGGNTYYITGKTSASVWTVRTATGTVPADLGATDVTSVSHSFSNLNAAVNATLSNNAGDSSHLNTKDLFANNYQLNIPCYYDTGADTTAVTIDGWTTGIPNYIKVYTPNNTTSEVNQSQRHQGKWDDSKYRLEVSSDWVNAIYNKEDYTKIIGLQIKLTSNNGFAGNIRNEYSQSISIESNILTGAFGSVGNPFAIVLMSGYNFVSNNILYENNYSNIGSGILFNTGVSYLYNNTVRGFLTGIIKSGGFDPVLKNNIANGNTTDYSGSFDASSANNISEDATSPNASFQNKAVSFLDETNKDFHLSQSDTYAKNTGGSLINDPYYAFTQDIDGNTRNLDSRGWDIGADEAATQIYFSASPETVQTDLKVASTVTINSSGLATFSAPQTGNMGVGDVIDYDTDNKKAYIVSKVDASNWYVQTVIGALPATVTGVTVNSIKHTYTSLSLAEAGASTLLGTSDLLTSNYQLNIPCYYQSAADTTAVTIDGWTTSPTNYIKVYTPNNTTTEANNSQRHQGKWDDGKWRLEASSGRSIDIFEEYVRIEGLQIKNLFSSGFYSILSRNDRGGDVQVSNSILNSNNATGVGTGIGGDYGGNTKVWNNIVYGFLGQGIDVYRGYVYNNLVINSNVGLASSDGTGQNILIKNNLSYNNTDNYYGTFDASSTNNLSGPAQTDAPGSNPQNAKTVHFVDENNYDFHLAPNDTSAREAGVDLTSDVYLPLTSDVDGHSRPTLGAFDIGADEGATAIYYSVGQNTNDHKTGTPTVTISSGTATFSEAQTATNMGVGDKLIAGGNDYYITGKTDTSNWTVRTATGTIPVDLSSTDVTSVSHVFANLNSGVNTSVASDASEILGTADIFSNNYQVNFPCYYDSGADTTAVTVDGWITGAPNYLRIYTPNNTNNEVNQSQRHNGKWDEGKYQLDINTNRIIRVVKGYVRINGLQISLTSPNNSLAGIFIYNDASETQVSNNIIQGFLGVDSQYNMGISVTGPNKMVKIWNNIIYGFSAANKNDNYGIYMALYPQTYVYNNTVYNTDQAYRNNTGGTGSNTMVLKNNVAQNCDSANCYFVGQIDAASTNNLSSDATAPAYGTYYRNATVTFADAANFDFHLSRNDTAAKNKGGSLINDPYLPFSSDIDGQTRTGDWSIGADDGPFTQISTPTEVNQNLNLDDGLVLYQSFNGEDLSGATSYDRSGNNNNGTISGATPTMGKRGQGMSFDGSDDTIGTSSYIPVPADCKYSISFWMKSMSVDTPTANPISWGYRGFMFYPGSGTDHISFSVDGSWWQGAKSVSNLNDMNWHHVVGVNEGNCSTSNLILYIDGVQEGTALAITNASQYYFIIGSGWAGNFPGQIDEARLYSRVLSSDEIGQLYRMGEDKINSSQKDNAKNGLIGLWTFDGPDVSGTTAYDRSGQGNNGTISGAAPAMGKKGQGMGFDGNDRVVTPLKMTGENFMTFSAWVKEGVGNTVNTNFSTNRYGWSVPGFLIYCYNGTQWRAKIHDASDAIIGTLGNSWNQIGFTYDGTYLKTYKNGVLVENYNIGSKTIAGDLGTYFGGSDNGFRGVIDEVRIYNRALSSDEVGDLYNLGKAEVRE
jgi:hypothetical protein